MSMACGVALLSSLGLAISPWVMPAVENSWVLLQPQHVGGIHCTVVERNCAGNLWAGAGLGLLHQHVSITAALQLSACDVVLCLVVVPPFRALVCPNTSTGLRRLNLFCSPLDHMNFFCVSASGIQKWLSCIAGVTWKLGWLCERWNGTCGGTLTWGSASKPL